MKSFLLLMMVCSAFIKSNSDFVDPTGTYILKGNIEKNKIVSHYGEIRVKLLTLDKVAICFYINKGYPGYESISFMDTLMYDDNHFVRYKPSLYADCTVLFLFSNRNAEIQQVYTDPRSGCSFGKGILISTVFKKFSSEQPVIQDLSIHGDIP
ncbi:MAG: hypothetical protein JST75_01480 [Bacteroidetes bacterium]|nr:hypothetical protein [Bacteroidota bacterium]